MKTQITKGIIALAAVPTASIYLFKSIEISIILFIVILLANVSVFLSIGFYLKNVISNYFWVDPKISEKLKK
ncbi:hypothetical protein [Lutibacter maritimus]|uniref:Uncharacterized protein n=1 Tax=Lutibacter maritimus TaxID=593133 RepID=A0A1I6NR93_9FLAO|nr:hypothetical protein [Lutibacter maritimus]SFS30437.1 hypothetical protein SAMN04488006_0437 [Lutibacter maritimus]